MLNDAILRRMYFAQSENYYSASKDALIKISTMAPKHAVNAANRMLDDAFSWAEEARVTTDYPALWITTTPLFEALVRRAGSLIRA